jgi:hypothetical protein
MSRPRLDTSIDEHKHARSSDLSHMRLLPRKLHEYRSMSQMNNNGSSEQTNFLSAEAQTTSTTSSKRLLAVKVMQNETFNKQVNMLDSDRLPIDCSSSAWTNNKSLSNRKRLKIQRYCHSASRKLNRIDRFQYPRIDSSVFILNA